MRRYLSIRVHRATGLLVAAAALSAGGQTAAPEVQHSITGVVREFGTGRPLTHIAVATRISPRPSNGAVAVKETSQEVTATTDQDGRYSLTDLIAGRYAVWVRIDRRLITKEVTIQGSQGSVDLNFEIPPAAVISGRVTDAHGEPVRDAIVTLFAREYQQGILKMVFKTGAVTNNSGEYRFRADDAGHPWFVRAIWYSEHSLPVSPVPRKAEDRRPALVATWYPGSPDANGAAPVYARSGQVIDGIDIRMIATADRCIEGVTEANGRPSEAFVFVNQGDVSTVRPIEARTGPDGRFRICSLYPGPYRLSAARFSGLENPEPPLFTSVPVSLGRTDVLGLRLSLEPGVRCAGKALLDRESGTETAEGRLSLFIEPLNRFILAGETAAIGSQVPGEFIVPGLIPDDYAVHAKCLGSGLFTKDVTYGGSSVLRAPLRAAQINSGSEFRVICSPDGASLDVAVREKDGSGAQNADVVVVPADVSSAAELATKLVVIKTDTNGQAQASGLAPGRYAVVTVPEPVDSTPEEFERVMTALRSKPQEVELAPRQHAAVTVENRR